MPTPMMSVPGSFCGPVDAMEVAVITDHAEETFQIDLDNAALMESWTFHLEDL